MGGSKSLELDRLAKDLWEWSISRKIWVSAGHIPGISNVNADEQSRHFNDKHESALNTGAFQKITAEHPELTVDLFATRLNHKFDTYCFWKPDPGCSFVDAFSLNWHAFNFYAFPPFSLIPRCLQKINKDKATGILIVPLWPSQPWFPFLLQHLYKPPWILTPDKNHLQHPRHQEPHPPRRKLNWWGALSQESLHKPQHFWTRCRHPHGILAVRHPKTVQDLHWTVAQVLWWKEN